MSTTLSCFQIGSKLHYSTLGNSDEHSFIGKGEDVPFTLYHLLVSALKYAAGREDVLVVDGKDLSRFAWSVLSYITYIRFNHVSQ